MILFIFRFSRLSCISIYWNFRTLTVVTGSSLDYCTDFISRIKLYRSQVTILQASSQTCSYHNFRKPNQYLDHSREISVSSIPVPPRFHLVFSCPSPDTEVTNYRGIQK